MEIEAGDHHEADHRACDKVFIDYSGKKPRLVDAETGEVMAVELFVMVLRASNYTYAEATLTQSASDFIDSTVRGFEYFGCVPEIAVPDQLRAAVTGPDRYDPEINPAYLEMAEPPDHLRSSLRSDLRLPRSIRNTCPSRRNGRPSGAEYARWLRIHPVSAPAWLAAPAVEPEPPLLAPTPSGFEPVPAVGSEAPNAPAAPSSALPVVVPRAGDSTGQYAHPKRHPLHAP